MTAEEVNRSRAMTDLDKLAKSLTKAQREAVCGRYAWADIIDEEEGEAGLYAKGIWNPRPKYGESIHTPLGLALRDHLKGQNDGCCIDNAYAIAQAIRSENDGHG